MVTIPDDTTEKVLFGKDTSIGGTPMPIPVICIVVSRVEPSLNLILSVTRPVRIFESCGAKVPEIIS